MRLSRFHIQPFVTNHAAFLTECWLLFLLSPSSLTPNSILTVTRSALCAPDMVKECVRVLAATGGLLHTQECNASVSTSFYAVVILPLNWLVKIVLACKDRE